MTDHPYHLGATVLLTAFALSTSGLLCLLFCFAGILSAAGLLLRDRFLA